MLRTHIKNIKLLRERGFSLARIGKKFKVSGERVRQVLKFGFKIFKCSMCKSELDGIKRRKFCEKHKIKLQGRDFIRETIRIRDNHTCQCCGKVWKKGMRRFDVHHLDEEFEGWDNRKNKDGTKNNKGIYQNDKKNMDRMITYCHKCHLNLDSVRYKMTLEGRK